VDPGRVRQGVCQARLRQRRARHDDERIGRRQDVPDPVRAASSLLCTACSSPLTSRLSRPQLLQDRNQRHRLVAQVAPVVRPPRQRARRPLDLAPAGHLGPGRREPHRRHQVRPFSLSLSLLPSARELTSSTPRRCLIAGPDGSPYAHGLFEFDIFLPLTYPQVSPKCWLRTTGGGTCRLNPNLVRPPPRASSSSAGTVRGLD